MIKRIGAILIIFSTIPSVVFLWAYIALPFFLLGVILIWTTRTKLKEKLLWTFLPIVFLILAWSIIQKISDREYRIQIRKQNIETTRYKEELDFIFDDTFEGEIFFTCNQPCGQENTIKGIGLSEYNIPKDGILLIRDSLNFDNIKIKFCQVSSNGIRKVIPLICTNNRNPKVVEVHQNHFNKHKINFSLKDSNYQETYLAYEVLRPIEMSKNSESGNQKTKEQRILEKIEVCK
jgi:hypothetical protein